MGDLKAKPIISAGIVEVMLVAEFLNVKEVRDRLIVFIKKCSHLSHHQHSLLGKGLFPTVHSFTYAILHGGLGMV